MLDYIESRRDGCDAVSLHERVYCVLLSRLSRKSALVLPLLCRGSPCRPYEGAYWTASPRIGSDGFSHSQTRCERIFKGTLVQWVCVVYCHLHELVWLDVCCPWVRLRA